MDLRQVSLFNKILPKSRFLWIEVVARWGKPRNMHKVKLTKHLVYQVTAEWIGQLARVSTMSMVGEENVLQVTIRIHITNHKIKICKIKWKYRLNRMDLETKVPQNSLFNKQLTQHFNNINTTTLQAATRSKHKEWLKVTNIQIHIQTTIWLNNQIMLNSNPYSLPLSLYKGIGYKRIEYLNTNYFNHSFLL